MSWFWTNMPLAAVFFAATAGIPLWLVLRHADDGPPGSSRSARSLNWSGTADATPQSRPVLAWVPAIGSGGPGRASRAGSDPRTPGPGTPRPGTPARQMTHV